MPARMPSAPPTARGRCASLPCLRRTSIGPAPRRARRGPAPTPTTGIRMGRARLDILMVPPGDRAALPTDPAALLDDDVTRHSCPVVIGADEREPAGLPGHEVEILLFAGLDHDLRAFRIQSLGIGDLHRLQEGGRGEFVQLLAPVLEAQAIGRSPAEGPAGRRGVIVASDEGPRLG